ncbi:hypothetical protein XELAEV_18043925mg [Xenopus laevis]|uniref:Uncharacterized protein n=1 Tax=Xenopus laevis TaxID=8355 RepID=A0A974BXM2_XENLA|nr:hypothetical protein XELAEV_18043925mg [Xenopus laevis]
MAGVSCVELCPVLTLLGSYKALCNSGSTFPVSRATNSYLIPLSQLAFNYCISNCQLIGTQFLSLVSLVCGFYVCDICNTLDNDGRG